MSDGPLFDMASRLIVGPMSTPSWTFQQDLALYRALNLKIINTSISKLPAVPIEELHSLFVEEGLTVHNLGLGHGDSQYNLCRPETWRD